MNILEKLKREQDLRLSVCSSRPRRDGLAGLIMSDEEIEKAACQYDEAMREIDKLWADETR